MQSVLPLEVKTLKHKTADQVPADRRRAFYLRFFASTAMSRLRNVRTTRKRFVKEYFAQSQILFKPVFKKNGAARPRREKKNTKRYEKVSPTRIFCCSLELSMNRTRQRSDAAEKRNSVLLYLS